MHMYLYMGVLLHVCVYSSPIWGGKSSSQSIMSSSSKITAPRHSVQSILLTNEGSDVNSQNKETTKAKPVLRIRIHLFLGLPDPDPDPLVRGMDPDPDPFIIMQK